MATVPEAPDWKEEVIQHLRAQRWQEAVDLLVSRVRTSPTDAQAWVFMAEALEHLGERAGAWRCYDRGWMLDPQAAWAPAAEARLQDVRGQSGPEWLEALLTVPKVRVVGAILAKDEAENIERCVRALLPAVDAVFVADTGSTDGTQDIAREAGATVVEVPWEDDFGKARSCLDPHLGTEGWVLWVDADEFLREDDVHVPRTVAGLYEQVDPPMLLRFVQVNHLGNVVDPNYDTTRMFPLGKGLSWRGRIHEQVATVSGVPMRIQRGAVRIRVDHWGYERSVMQARDKFNRNIRLLRAWTQDEPKNPAAWGFLGRDLFISGSIEEAINALYQAERLGQRDRNYARLPEVRAVLCEALVRLKRLEEARVVAERTTQDAPDFPTGWYWKGHIALLQANEAVQTAIAASRKVRELAPRYRGLVSVNPDIPQFLAPVTEADALKMAGQWEAALALYQQATRVKPDHEGVKQQIASLTERARRIASQNPGANSR
ncbi:MAG: glycosyltransferase family 2 protein [Firmicutes bacterium]|nr:glycosyltransferase family 2 protein [Bacillota bacterium]